MKISASFPPMGWTPLLHFPHPPFALSFPHIFPLYFIHPYHSFSIIEPLFSPLSSNLDVLITIIIAFLSIREPASSDHFQDEDTREYYLPFRLSRQQKRKYHSSN